MRSAGIWYSAHILPPHSLLVLVTDLPAVYDISIIPIIPIPRMCTTPGAKGHFISHPSSRSCYGHTTSHLLTNLEQVSSKSASEDEVESIQCGVEERGKTVYQTLSDDRLTTECLINLLSKQEVTHQVALLDVLQREREPDHCSTYPTLSLTY